MNPFMDCGMTRERNMSDEMLDKALDVLHTLTWAYSNSKSKIEEYERSKK